MKFILMFIILLQCILGYGQSDLTGLLLKNGDFEQGIHYGWELELKGEAVACLNDAGKLESAYGAHAAKIVVSKKQFIHYVVLRKWIEIESHQGKTLNFSVKAAAIESEMTCSFRINAYGANNHIVDYAQNKMQLQDNGKFKTYAIEFTIPNSAKRIELLIWCGSEEGTYLFDDFTVNR